jgi:hypothetical protein
MPLDGMVPSDTYFTPTIFVFEKLNQIWEYEMEPNYCFLIVIPF